MSQPAIRSGFDRLPLLALIAGQVAMRTVGEVITGRLGPGQALRFLCRAAFFLSVLGRGPLLRVGRCWKLHLWVPAWPSPAFDVALAKLIAAEPGPTSVVLSMTRACPCRCAHCYQRHDQGPDLPLPELLAAARTMQAAGVCLFNLEGGEPFARPQRLSALCRGLDRRAEIWVNTSGVGVDRTALRRLRHDGVFGVMVSLHAPTAERHDAFTGVPGSFAAAVRALALCREAGLVTAINCCPADGQGLKKDLEAIVAGARRHGCAYVQFIHPKAAGAWLGRGEVVRGRTGFLELLRRSGRRRRIVPPAVCSQADEEAADRFGCTAGGIERFYVGAGGEVQPCEFLNLSVGRLGDEAFPVLLRRLRGFFPRPTTAWPCCDQAIAIAAAIRAQGGRTPLPWPASRPLLEALSVGDEPAVYRRLGIYRCGSR